MPETNTKNKKLQLFSLKKGKLHIEVFTDAISNKGYILFNKVEVGDCSMFEGNLLESHLGKVDADLFSANARVAFFEEEDATEKAIELLEEHLKNYKKKEEEEHQNNLKYIQALENDLNKHMWLI